MGAREGSVRMARRYRGKGGLQRILVRHLDADETAGFRFGAEIGIQGPTGCLRSPGTPPPSPRKPATSFWAWHHVLLSSGPLYRLAPLVGVTSPSTPFKKSGSFLSSVLL